MPLVFIQWTILAVQTRICNSFCHKRLNIDYDLFGVFYFEFSVCTNYACDSHQIHDILL